MSQSPFPMEKKRFIGVIAILTFGLTALLAVLSFDLPVAPTFVLGFFLVLPLVALLGDDLPVIEAEDATDGDAAVTEPTDPVRQLRERNARGQIDVAEFERKLERLLETEELERQVSERERSVELE